MPCMMYVAGQMKMMLAQHFFRNVVSCLSSSSKVCTMAKIWSWLGATRETATCADVERMMPMARFSTVPARLGLFQTYTVNIFNASGNGNRQLDVQRGRPHQPSSRRCTTPSNDNYMKGAVLSKQVINLNTSKRFMVS